MKAAIVIPVAQTNDSCLKMLDDLLGSIVLGGYFELDYGVILCYDNVSDEFQETIFKKYEGKRIAAISNRNPKNLNFVKNSNTGLRLAQEANVDNVVLLNMDTLLPPAGIFDNLLGEGLTFPTPVDISPITNVKEASMSLTGGKEFTKVLKYSGFCMIMSKSLLDKVGILDERFTAGMDDDDLSVRTLLAGLPVRVGNVQVHHYLKDRDNVKVSTTGAYDLPSLGISLEILRRKYSVPPIPHEQFNQWILDNYEWDELLKCT